MRISKRSSQLATGQMDDVYGAACPGCEGLPLIPWLTRWQAVVREASRVSKRDRSNMAR